jgi:hypothetical protein
VASALAAVLFPVKLRDDHNRRAPKNISGRSVVLVHMGRDYRAESDGGNAAPPRQPARVGPVSAAIRADGRPRDRVAPHRNGAPYPPLRQVITSRGGAPKKIDFARLFRG